MRHVSNPDHPEYAPIQVVWVVFPRIRHLLGDPAFYNSGLHSWMLLTTIRRNDDKTLVSSTIFPNLEGSCTVHGRTIRSVWGCRVEWGHHMSFRMELQRTE